MFSLEQHFLILAQVSQKQPTKWKKKGQDVAS